MKFHDSMMIRGDETRFRRDERTLHWCDISTNNCYIYFKSTKSPELQSISMQSI